MGTEIVEIGIDVTSDGYAAPIIMDFTIGSMYTVLPVRPIS